MPLSFHTRSALTDALLRIVPESAEFQWSRAELDARRAQTLIDRQQPDEAVELYKKSLQQKDAIVRRYPDAVHWKLAYGKSFTPPALLFERLGRIEEAIALFRRGIDVLQSLETNSIVAGEVAIALQSQYNRLSNLMLHRIPAFHHPLDHD